MYLQSLLSQLQELRVLVIGDLMLDHYIWGDVHRISPEAPVPVVQVSNDSFTAGGAANVALNLTNLGVRTSVMGYIAHDDAGNKLEQILGDSQVAVLNPYQHSTIPTIIKTRVLVRSQQLCRIDRELGREHYRIDAAPGFEEMLENALANTDAVILSDYAKGVVTQTLVDCLMKMAKQFPRLLVAVDPKPARRLSFTGAGLLTPNRAEALELAGMSTLQPEENYPLHEICARIHEIYKPDLLVITLGVEGMAICNNGKVVEHLPTAAQQVFDVSGAGDTVIAILTAALAAGAEPSQAARLANAAAGCVVAHMGTAPVTLEELHFSLERASGVVL
ncbi:MAG: PfkB family carbohydrate kinase [Chitinophagaceae bacterium]